MVLKRIALSFIYVLSFSHITAQVPVTPEPVAFKFENYTLNPIYKIENQAPSLPSIQVPSIPTYNTQANSQVHNPSMWMIEKYYVPSNLSPQEQLRYADEQIRLHELEKRQNEQSVMDAISNIDEMHISYEFPFEELAEKKSYAVAFVELEKMIKGESPLNIEKAVFMVEHAFDPSLKFEQFDNDLNKSASVIGLKMQQDKISPSDNLGKIMTTFKFFADTISVATKAETHITTYPKKYDFEDFWGRMDYRKMFVSKLLKEGSGQCHSLPLLFLVLCEKIGAEAHLAFAPNHSFVKFQDKKSKWHNIELTNSMLVSDHFMIESGYIKAEAMQNKIYLEPLSKKQVVVQCLNDLALTYQKKYGYDGFVKECALTALNYHSNNLTARQIVSNYYNALGSYVISQYKEKGLTKAQFDQDEMAKQILENAKDAVNTIEGLGYADMPPEVYERWLNSIQKESSRQQHNNEIKILGGMIELKR